MADEQNGANDDLPSNKRIGKVLDRYRIVGGDGFRLKDHDPGDSADAIVDKADAQALLDRGVRHLAAFQELLYANATWSVLVVLQAMDAAGKDGTIKHVMSGVNPQGIAVTSFKQPGPEDLAHDFLWRVSRALPAAGMIGIFNRSHYEEVLVARVHPEIMARQHLPPERIGHKKFWDHRLEDIVAFERHLARRGTIILKFFLNMSRDEQKRRFLSRLDEPGKNWKFSAADIAERARWPDYMEAYQEAIAGTATKEAPWFVVPADNKWFARLVVVAAINQALRDLDLKPVELSAEEKARLVDARRALEAED